MPIPTRCLPPSALLLLLLALGCATPDEASLPGPIVIEKMGRGEEEDPEQRAWQERFARLHAASKEGNLAAMETILAAMPTGKRPGWVEKRVAYYRANLRARRLFAEGRIKVLFTVGRPFYAGEESVSPRFLVKNDSPGELVLPPAGDEALVDMTLLIRDVGFLGNSHENRVTRGIRIEKPLVIPPGGRGDISFPHFKATIGAGAVLRSIFLEGRLVLGGGRIMVDGEYLPLQSVPVGKVEFRVFDRGFRKIQEKPLDYLARALASGKPKHLKVIYLAGYFMPRSLRDRAGRLLVEQLEELSGRDRLGRVIMATLKVMTGWDLPILDPKRDGEQWIRRWRSRRGEG